MKGTDNEERIGPERAIQSGAISPDEMMHGIKLKFRQSGIYFLNTSIDFGVPLLSQQTCPTADELNVLSGDNARTAQCSQI